MVEEIQPLTLKIDKKLWSKFKERVHRDTSLNKAVVFLVKSFVEENKFYINADNTK